MMNFFECDSITKLTITINQLDYRFSKGLFTNYCIGNTITHFERIGSKYRPASGNKTLSIASPIEIGNKLSKQSWNNRSNYDNRKSQRCCNKSLGKALQTTFQNIQFSCFPTLLCCEMNLDKYRSFEVNLSCVPRATCCPLFKTSI